MIALTVHARLSCILGVLLCGLVVSACTFGGSSSPTDSVASTDTAATTVSTSLPQTASPDQASPAPPSSNEARSVAQHLNDASVEARIKRALVDERSLRLFDFQPEVVNGHARIQGNVNSLEQYRRAERVTREVEGVEAVTNELTVNGEPVSDDGSTTAKAEASSGSDRKASGVYYTVKRGDTLWEIAREYETSVRQIRSLNDLHSSSLSPGTRIRIR